MRRWVYDFAGELPPGADARAVLGGKGAGLSELIRAGFAVPPGFTIISEACRWFLDQGGVWPPELETQVRAHLGKLELATGRTFGAGVNRLLVSVRSGAAVSMPGMLDTRLNVGGSGDAWSELTRAVEDVFRSWTSERAAAYRARHRLNGLPGTAVNVQVMFPSQVAGVVFTEDPRAPLAQRMVVEAARGLGEAVVSGAVTPDRFFISREGLYVMASVCSGSPVLPAAELRRLCELALRVERHFGQPQDIEWAWADGQLVLLQSRAIRGLEVGRDAEACRREEIERLRARVNGKRRVWVAHNLGETLPQPTPLTWDIVSRFMTGAGGFGRLYRDLGYHPATEVCEHGFLELIAGRIYADADRAARLFWAGLPMSYDLEMLRRDSETLHRAPTRFDPELVDGSLLWRLPGWLRGMWRSARLIRHALPGARARFEREAVPRFVEYVRRARAADLARLETSALLEELTVRRRLVLDEFGAESLRPGFLGALALGELERLLLPILGPTEASRWAVALTHSGEGDITREQETWLTAVAEGRAPLADFLERFGHRCADEMELMTPRWREDTTFLEEMIRRRPGSPGTTLLSAAPRDGQERGQAAWEKLPGLLANAGASALREEIEERARLARALLPCRESGKHFLMMGYELIRLVLLELARRWELGDDVFFLRLDELDRFEREEKELRTRLPSRKLRWESARRLVLPAVIDSNGDLDRLGLPPAPSEAATNGALQGLPVSGGVSDGRVFIASNPDEAANLGADGILVCPSTDPGWAPLFLRVRALVVERGGLLSHGAIVARDFGIPAVVCPEVTRRLRPGERIRVDGNSGTITRLETTQEATHV